MPVQVDGPYGGVSLQKYRDSDRILVIAGGSGAGWILPFVERFARNHLITKEKENDITHPDAEKQISNEGYAEGSVPGPKSVRVILATRDAVSRTWFLSTFNRLLARYSPVDVHVEVFLTGNAAQEVHMSEQREAQRSASSSEEIEVHTKDADVRVPGKELKGRPRLQCIIQEEASNAAEAKESLGVFVCGPDTMQNDVRNAVAAENMKIMKGSQIDGVYLHSEHFSWA